MDNMDDLVASAASTVLDHDGEICAASGADIHSRAVRPSRTAASLRSADRRLGVVRLVIALRRTGLASWSRAEPPGKPRLSRFGDAILLACILIWSLNTTVVKSELGNVAPLAFAIARYSLGTAFILIFAWPTLRGLRFQRRDIAMLGAAALVGTTINQLTFVGALALSPVTDFALLGATSPLWAVALAAVTHQEIVGRRQWMGVGLGLAGVALVVGGAGNFATEASLRRLAGDLAGLGCAASWGALTVQVRPLMDRYSVLQVAAITMVVGTAALAPLAAPQALAQDWSVVDTSGWLALGFSAILAISVTNIFYFRAIRRVGATRVAMFMYLQPPLTLLFAIPLLGESMTILQVMGGALVLAAIVVSRAEPRAE